jgi:hypothetical protein
MDTNTKWLLFAFGIAVIGWIALFSMLRPILHEQGHLAIALHPLYESLEKIHTRRRLSTARQAALTVEQFSIPWYLTAVYGALVIFGVLASTPIVGGVLYLVYARVYPSLASDLVFFMVVQAVSYPLKLIGVYFAGRWIGARCIKRGVIATISALVLGYTLALSIEFWTTDVTHLGARKTVGSFFRLVATSSCVLAVPALLGFWVGVKARPSQYLRYLLRLLPLGTQATIVTLAFDEAQRLSIERARADDPDRGQRTPRH